jgi:hypothetical protein
MARPALARQNPTSSSLTIGAVVGDVSSSERVEALECLGHGGCRALPHDGEDSHRLEVQQRPCQRRLGRDRVQPID